MNKTLLLTEKELDYLLNVLANLIRLSESSGMNGDGLAMLRTIFDKLFEV